MSRPWISRLRGLFWKSRAEAISGPTTDQPKFHYYVVEYSFIARIDRDTHGVERLLADGSWEHYDDSWDVLTNGRFLDGGEPQAMETYRHLLVRDWNWAEERDGKLPPGGA